MYGMFVRVTPRRPAPIEVKENFDTAEGVAEPRPKRGFANLMQKIWDDMEKEGYRYGG